MKRVSTLKDIHSNIVRMQQKSAVYRNERRKTMPQLKKGDKVYLLTKNLKTKKASKKLNHVKIGPFFINKQIGSVNYKLDLPPDIRIHQVFHVSLLEDFFQKCFEVIAVFKISSSGGVKIFLKIPQRSRFFLKVIAAFKISSNFKQHKLFLKFFNILRLYSIFVNVTSIIF